MRILITGASGFAGSHLGNHLAAQDHEVIGIDDQSHASDNKTNFPVHTHRAGETPGHLIASADAIFHLAAHINVDESILKPREYFRENVDDTIELLELVRKHNPDTRFIYASTSEVYGTALAPAISESHPTLPLSPYAVSKLAADRLCDVYAGTHNLAITIVRNFNTFGEYQRGTIYGGVIAKFTTQALQGGPLTVYGDGEQTRDYMHISQAIVGYTMALKGGMPRMYNCGSGTAVRIIDIANHIAKKYGVRIEHSEARPNEVQNLCADISLARAHGYQATTDFWSMLDRYCEWRAASAPAPVPAA